MVELAGRHERGVAARRSATGSDGASPATPTGAGLVDYVYGEVWTRGGLGERDRQLVTLTCAAGVGATDVLAAHVHGALSSGALTIDELREAVLQFALYRGWALAAAFDRVVDERATALGGEPGDGAVAIEPPADRAARSERAVVRMQEVAGLVAPPSGQPYIDDGVLGFVFGELWDRPVLSQRDRRWVTVTCAALVADSTPVRAHVFGALQAGDLTRDELDEWVMLCACWLGWPQGSILHRVVGEVATQVGL